MKEQIVTLTEDKEKLLSESEKLEKQQKKLQQEMTDMEKVMVRLWIKIVAETELYETDKKVQNLIDWVRLSEQIKENDNTIRNLIGKYKKIKPDCREGVRVRLKRMKEFCKERNSLYEKQNELKG